PWPRAFRSGHAKWSEWKKKSGLAARNTLLESGCIARQTETMPGLAAQKLSQTTDRFLQAVHASGVGQAQGVRRVGRTKVPARHSGHSGLVQQLLREGIAVLTVFTNIRINIESAIRAHGYA